MGTIYTRRLMANSSVTMSEGDKINICVDLALEVYVCVC